MYHLHNLLQSNDWYNTKKYNSATQQSFIGEPQSDYENHLIINSLQLQFGEIQFNLINCNTSAKKTRTKSDVCINIYSHCKCPVVNFALCNDVRVKTFTATCIVYWYSPDLYTVCTQVMQLECEIKF